MGAAALLGISKNPILTTCTGELPRLDNKFYDR